MKPLTLYAYTFRSRAERVLWTLRELELSYHVIRLDAFKGEALTPEFLALNPQGKIPVLVHEDRVLTESLAIMEYLNDISPMIKLLPNTIDEAYACKRALYFAATEIEPYLWVADQATRLRKIYPWPEGSSDTAIERATKALRSAFAELEKHPYIAGNQFTLADIYYYQIITWAKSYITETTPAVEKYLALLEARIYFPVEMTGRIS